MDVVVQALMLIANMLAVNYMLSLSLTAMVIFHRQISAIWNKVCSFLYGVTRVIRSFLVLIFVFTIGLVYYAGLNGSYVLDELNTTRILPMVCFCCLEFADFMVTLFDFYLDRHTGVEKSLYIKVDFETAEYNTQYEVFEQPSPVLLQ